MGESNPSIQRCKDADSLRLDLVKGYSIIFNPHSASLFLQTWTGEDPSFSHPWANNISVPIQAFSSLMCFRISTAPKRLHFLVNITKNSFYGYLAPNFPRLGDDSVRSGTTTSHTPPSMLSTWFPKHRIEASQRENLNKPFWSHFMEFRSTKKDEYV